jgi:translation initiation factor 6 (eIF-6)
MATRCAFENSNEIGVFCALTNSYCLTGKFIQFGSIENELNAPILFAMSKISSNKL